MIELKFHIAVFVCFGGGEVGEMGKMCIKLCELNVTICHMRLRFF